MVEHQVDGRPGCDGGELLQQLDRLEEEMGGAIAPHCLELDEDAAVGAELDAVLGERGAEEVAAEPFEAGAVVGGDPDIGVEIEAIELGLAGAAGGGVTGVRLVAEAADAGAGPWAQRDAALDGGADEASQDRRSLRERVGRHRVVFRLEPVAGEQLSDTGADGGEDLRHVLIARWGRGVKGEVSWPSFVEDAVQHERMEVDVQLEATGEALDHGDRAGLAVLDAVGPGGARVEGEERADIHAAARRGTRRDPRRGGSGAGRVTSAPIAAPARAAAPRRRERGAFGHAAPATAWAEAASLAGERQQMLERTVRTPKPRETMAQDATREELAELLLDEAGQAMSVAAVRDFPEEGFEVLADDGVEHGVLGVAGLIRAVGMGHALG